MAFNGSLLTFGGTKVPLKYIKADSYKVVPNRRQDLDPYRDANGNLHRNTLSHTATTISFETKPMWNSDFATFMALLRNNYSNTLEKKISVTYYCPDLDSYKTGTFYVPDVEYSIYMIKDGTKILYNPVTIELIEY